MPGIFLGLKFQACVFFWVCNMKLRRTPLSCILRVPPWEMNLMQNESNSIPCLHDTSMNSPRYDSHCYEILCFYHVTNTEKQERTGVNLYQNEKHTMNWCHANTPSD